MSRGDPLSKYLLDFLRLMKPSSVLPAEETSQPFIQPLWKKSISIGHVCVEFLHLQSKMLMLVKEEQELFKLKLFIELSNERPNLQQTTCNCWCQVIKTYLTLDWFCNNVHKVVKSKSERIRIFKPKKMQSWPLQSQTK